MRTDDKERVRVVAAVSIPYNDNGVRGSSANSTELEYEIGVKEDIT